MSGTGEPARKRVLVTGATGFLGSRLVRKFLEQNHEVTILKRSFSDTRRIASCQKDLRVWDLDRGTVDHAFEALGPFDAVVHTATSYGRKGESPLAVFEANLAFPLSLLQAAVSSGTPLFVNTGTFYTKTNRFPSAMTYYSLSKKQFEEWGAAYAADRWMKFMNVRLEHVYGPDDSPSKFVTFIMKSLANHVPKISLTLGEQKRDFIHVEDAVNAYAVLLDACEGETGYEEFQLGSGDAVSIRKFVEIVKDMVRSDTELAFGEKEYDDHEIMFSKADIGKLNKLGWKPAYSLEEGIRDTLKKEIGLD